MHVQTIRFAEATISLNPEEASRLAAATALGHIPLPNLTHYHTDLDHLH